MVMRGRIAIDRLRVDSTRLALIGYLILACATGAAFYATHSNSQEVERARVERIGQLNTINAFQCRALRNLYTSIRQSITDSDRRLGQIEYYRTHPDEMLAAHKANVAQLNRYNLPPCPDRIMVDAK